MVDVGQAVTDGAAIFRAFAAPDTGAEMDLLGQDSDIAVGWIDSAPHLVERVADDYVYVVAEA